MARQCAPERRSVREFVAGELQTPGARTLTITASYGSQVASAQKTVTVTNSAPQIAFNFTGDPQQGEPFLVRAILSDVNEPDPASMCAVTQWVVDAPDAIAGGEGCSRTIRFGAAGSRSLTVRTHDRDASRFTVGAAPIRCVLAVRVNAPEPARSKTLTLWSGRCINYSDIN